MDMDSVEEDLGCVSRRWERAVMASINLSFEKVCRPWLSTICSSTTC